MRKIVIGSTLGLAAITGPAQALAISTPGEPAGVTAAGKVSLAEAPGNRGPRIRPARANPGQSAHKAVQGVKGQTGDGSVLKTPAQTQLKTGYAEAPPPPPPPPPPPSTGPITPVFKF